MRTVVKLKLQPLVFNFFTHETLTYNKKKIFYYYSCGKPPTIAFKHVYTECKTCEKYRSANWDFSAIFYKSSRSIFSRRSINLESIITSPCKLQCYRLG